MLCYSSKSLNWRYNKHINTIDNLNYFVLGATFKIDCYLNIRTFRIKFSSTHRHWMFHKIVEMYTLCVWVFGCRLCTLFRVLCFTEHRNIENLACQSSYQVHSVAFHLSIWLAQDYCFFFFFDMPYESNTHWCIDQKFKKKTTCNKEYVSVSPQAKWKILRERKKKKKKCIDVCQMKMLSFGNFVNELKKKNRDENETISLGNDMGIICIVCSVRVRKRVWKALSAMMREKRIPSKRRAQTNGTKLHSLIRDRLRFFLCCHIHK